MADKTVSCLAARRLKMRAKKDDPIDGTALHNIYKIGLEVSIIADIKSCLESENDRDIADGLYYIMGLLEKYDLKDFGMDFARYLIKRLPTLIDQNIGTQACYYAVDFYIWLKDNYPNYREKMMVFLNSDDLGYSRRALSAYETYCKEMEIEPLLKFEHHEKAFDQSMSGPWVYEFRDIALEQIGKLAGENFLIKKVSEHKNTREIFWYSWEPFWEWWNKRSKKKSWLPKFGAK
jgi:hypothetical protein